MNKFYILCAIILLCCGLIALGLSQVEITMSQFQQNDQSQKAIQNQITKVSTINLYNKDMQNLRYTNDYHSPALFYSLATWQQVFCHFERGIIYYPVLDKKVVYTNFSDVTNDTHTINSNETKVKLRLFEKVKDWFK